MVILTHEITMMVTPGGHLGWHPKWLSRGVTPNGCLDVAESDAST